jgi:tRNA-specific 2-thiouridylase
VPHELRHELRRAVDHQADQSYFLYAIDAAVLEHLVLPLGDLLRSEVRSQALQQGLIRGKSSQDICFLVGQDLRSFLAERVDATPGDIVDLEGRVLGRHDGLPFYTVGQRHGLGIALGTPAYVVRLDARRNRVVLGTADALLSASARLQDVRWLVQPERDEFPAQARIRYRARCTSAQVTLKESEALVRFLEPQRAVAPGQSVVFYDGDTVLGGGVVAETFARVHDAD